MTLIQAIREFVRWARHRTSMIGLRIAHKLGKYPNGHHIRVRLDDRQANDLVELAYQRKVSIVVLLREALALHLPGRRRPQTPPLLPTASA